MIKALPRAVGWELNNLISWKDWRHRSRAISALIKKKKDRQYRSEP